MKAAIFGAGKLGKAIKKGLEKHYGVQVCAIFDNDESKWGQKIDNVIISSPQELKNNIIFEKIFLCVDARSDYSAIRMQLENMEIPKEKIVYYKTSIEYKDALEEIDPVRKNWMRAFSEYTKEFGMLGSVAECGVYYGETAMFINKYWPDRTLHLFDTFEGFPDQDLAYDMNSFPAFRNGIFSANPFRHDTSDSILEVVKGRMDYPGNVKMHKGYFPECAGVIEDRFCFVNLDMDLYQPQLEGLRYFWNKMEPGGVILLHDYYNPALPGVKAAVTDFEKELGGMPLKFPIGDDSSIAIIKH